MPTANGSESSDIGQSLDIVVGIMISDIVAGDICRYRYRIVIKAFYEYITVLR
jgi:hypothetical protein